MLTTRDGGMTPVEPARNSSTILPSGRIWRSYGMREYGREFGADPCNEKRSQLILTPAHFESE